MHAQQGRWVCKCHWAVWELFWDLCSPPWVFCLYREGCSVLCGGRFGSRINEKLHLESLEKSIFTIYLTSCIAKAHIRRCWLMLAYGSVFLMHPLPLLWSSVSRLPPQPCPLSLVHFSCAPLENSFFSAEMKYGTPLEVWESYWRNGSNITSQDLSVLFG